MMQMKLHGMRAWSEQIATDDPAQLTSVSLMNHGVMTVGGLCMVTTLTVGGLRTMAGLHGMTGLWTPLGLGGSSATWGLVHKPR